MDAGQVDLLRLEELKRFRLRRDSHDVMLGREQMHLLFIEPSHAAK